MTVATIHVRVDADVKSGSEEILEKIGISLSDFVNMSLKRLLFEERIPFSTHVADTRMPENMRVENREQLVQLIKDAVDKDDGTRYTIDEIFDELGVAQRSS